jgi:hypothetical protein
MKTEAATLHGIYIVMMALAGLVALVTPYGAKKAHLP